MKTKNRAIFIAMLVCLTMSIQVQADSAMQEFHGFTPVGSDAIKAIHPLSKTEEQRLTILVKERKTTDGSTVAAVLMYAEKLRKKQFKVASIEVLYTSKNKPSVGICYWIGTGRSEQDEICNLQYELSPDRTTLIPNGYDTQRLDDGRQEFLNLIDEIYNSNCAPIAGSKKNTC
jgi:hypothetical protein